MIAHLIRWSARNIVLVLIGAALAAAAGVYAVRHVPLDAIPDLSDTQVIVYTEYPGPGAAGGRGPGHLPADRPRCWPCRKVEGGARLLVLRRVVRLRDLRGRHRHLLGAQPRARIPELRPTSGLPAGVTPTLGPDATGVGWVYQYAVLGDAHVRLAELRTLQDWYIRFGLAKAEGVAEVASVGGFVRQYQVVVDPRPPAGLRHSARARCARRSAQSNSDVGGRVVEMAETEYMVRGTRLPQRHRRHRADRA